jgi:hypothetical protein
MTNFDWSKVSVHEINPLPSQLQSQPDAEPFARLPLTWAAKATAATNTPKAFVWIWLVHRARKTKSNTVSVSNEVLARYGVSSKVKRAALRQLQAAGLISVEYSPGKAPLVTLLR